MVSYTHGVKSIIEVIKLLCLNQTYPLCFTEFALACYQLENLNVQTKKPGQPVRKYKDM